MTKQATTPGADPDDWSGERVTRWLRMAAGLERQLAPVSATLFDAAALSPGEAVLDVGCGTGPTTREAAARVGAPGRVTGLDISAEMLAAAARSDDAPEGDPEDRAAGDPPLGDRARGDRAPIDWLEADAARWSPPAASYDAVVSRFGVMFFSNPPAAVRALAQATRPGGRLAVAVWGPRPASPLFELPYRVALETLAGRAHAVEPLPVDGGPFSWHDPAYVTTLLSGAGWSDVEVVVRRLALPFGGGVGARDAAHAALDFGPTRLLLSGADDAATRAVAAALEAALEPHCDDAGHVILDAEIRIVNARR